MKTIAILISLTLLSCSINSEELEECIEIQKQLNDRITELEEQVEELETLNSDLQDEIDNCQNEVSNMELDNLFRDN